MKTDAGSLAVDFPCMLNALTSPSDTSFVNYIPSRRNQGVQKILWSHQEHEWVIHCDIGAGTLDSGSQKRFPMRAWLSPWPQSRSARNTVNEHLFIWVDVFHFQSVGSWEKEYESRDHRLCTFSIRGFNSMNEKLSVCSCNGVSSRRWHRPGTSVHGRGEVLSNGCFLAMFMSISWSTTLVQTQISTRWIAVTFLNRYPCFPKKESRRLRVSSGSLSI